MHRCAPNFFENDLQYFVFSLFPVDSGFGRKLAFARKSERHVLTIFGAICLENWLNYVELVCEELSEIVGCFSYVMLYMCKKLA